MSQILAARKDGCKSEGSAKWAPMAGPSKCTGMPAAARRRVEEQRARVRRAQRSGWQRRREARWRRLRSEGLLEARGGDPRAWKRKGDSGWSGMEAAITTTAAPELAQPSRRSCWPGGLPPASPMQRGRRRIEPRISAFGGASTVHAARTHTHRRDALHRTRATLPMARLHAASRRRRCSPPAQPAAAEQAQSPRRRYGASAAGRRMTLLLGSSWSLHGVCCGPVSLLINW